MKYFSLSLAASISGSALAFNDMVLGGSKNVGSVSWSEKQNVLTVVKPDVADCSTLSTAFKIYNNPYPVNDQLAPTANKEYCQQSQLANSFLPEAQQVLSSGNINTFEHAIENDASSPCVSTSYLENVEINEFNTFVLTDDDDCATMHKGKTSYGEISNSYASIKFYRSYNWKHHAMHTTFTVDNDAMASYNLTYFYDEDCVNANMIKMYEVDHSNKQNWHKLMTHGEDANERKYVAKSISVQDQCINLRKDIDFAPAAKFGKLFEDEYGDDTTLKSITRFAMAQDNIFEPTKYELFFTRVMSEMNTTDSNNNLNGYHIHNNPLDANDHTNCLATGGHFHPYAAFTSAPWDASSDYGVETGDLARRYKYFGSRTNSDDTYYDFNLPLHGDNTVLGRSIVFHRQSDGARAYCINLVEKKHYKGRYD